MIVFVYHEAHEDHEVFFNLSLLCVLRALRGEISLLLKQIRARGRYNLIKNGWVTPWSRGPLLHRGELRADS